MKISDLGAKTALNAYNYVISEAVDRRGAITSDDRLRAMIAAIGAYIEFGGDAARSEGEIPANSSSPSVSDGNRPPKHYG